MQPDSADINRIIEAALAEDIGAGDLTTEALIPSNLNATMAFCARQPLVCCGLSSVVPAVFAQLSKAVECKNSKADGTWAKAGEELACVQGPAHALLTGERTALNLLQRLCAVATVTAEYVAATHGTNATILDTRKTMPGLRVLDKYAVRAGGGKNHRMRLDDMIMIKDNHIALAGGIEEAISLACKHAPQDIPIVVECDTLEQVKAALNTGADRLLLDNMAPDQLREAVRLNAGRKKLEASGGITLEKVHTIAETGVDFISVGALTHSTPSVDIGLDIRFH